MNGLAAVLALSVLATTAPATTVPTGGLVGVDVTEVATTVEFALPPRTRSADEVEGLRAPTTPGAPSLPARVLFFAVPPHARVELRVLGSSHRDFGVDWIEPVASADGARLPDPVLYATDALVPAAVVAITERGVARDVDFVRIEVRPLQWNPVRGTLRVHERIRFRIDHPSPTTRRTSTLAEVTRAASLAAVTRGPFFANGPVPPAWRLRRPAPGGTVHNPAASGEAYKILVTDDGLYRIPFADFQATGLTTTPIADLHVARRGERVATWVQDADADGSFGPGDSLELYATANDDRWSAVEHYWLTTDGGGLAMRTAAAFPPGSERWPSVATAARSLHLEQNEMRFDYAPHDPFRWDPWVWDTLEQGDGLCLAVTSTLAPTVELTRVAPLEPGRDYQVRGRLLSREPTACIASDQLVELSVNGVAAASVSWDSLVDGTWFEFAQPYDPSVLVSGSNTVLAETPLAPDALRLVYVDWLELDYQGYLTATDDRLEVRGTYADGAVLYASGFSSGDLEVVDIRSDGTVERLVGVRSLASGPGMPRTVSFGVGPSQVEHQLVVYARTALKTAPVVRDTPSDLRDPGTLGAYTGIAHDEFLSAAVRLTDWRAARDGLTTQLIDVQDVYDEFSYGNVDPRAIREFLGEALANWAEPPLYVVLVGDSTDDPRDYRGHGLPLYIPHGYRVRQGTSIQVRAVDASDAWYQLLVGSDSLPDVLLGRIAAQTAAEVGLYADKLATYETAASAPWNGRSLMVVDDDMYATGACDPGLNDAEQFAIDMACCYLGGAPAGDVTLLLEDDLGWPAGQDAVIDAHNQGLSFGLYYGHGSVTKLGRKCDSFFSIFGSDELPQLTHPEAFPLFVAVSEYGARFDFVDVNTGLNRAMGELFTASTARGHLGFIGQTSHLTIADGKGLIKGVLDGLFQAGSSFLPPWMLADARERAGAIHYAAQVGLLTNPVVFGPARDDAALTNVLLGDPAAHLAIELPPPPSPGTCTPVPGFCP